MQPQSQISVTSQTHLLPHYITVWKTLLIVHIFNSWFMTDLHVLGCEKSKYHKVKVISIFLCQFVCVLFNGLICQSVQKITLKQKVALKSDHFQNIEYYTGRKLTEFQNSTLKNSEFIQIFNLLTRSIEKIFLKMYKL